MLPADAPGGCSRLPGGCSTDGPSRLVGQLRDWQQLTRIIGPVITEPKRGEEEEEEEGSEQEEWEEQRTGSVGLFCFIYYQISQKWVSKLFPTSQVMAEDK